MGKPSKHQLKKPGGLAQALFAQVQLRVLGLLIGQPDRDFHGAEIIRLVASGSGAVQRELQRLAQAGIINVAASGNRKMYRANKQSPIFEELHGLILKTVGLVDPIRDALKKFKPKIGFAFVYGSVAKGLDTARSDIDLMIVGDDLAYAAIFSALQTAEKTLGRSTSPNLMTSGEWDKKLADGNPFVEKILGQPKLFVFGSEGDSRPAIG
jgi:predicted nucleotidyltransferase